METWDGLWTTIILVITAVSLYAYRHYTKLRRCGISGPTPLPLFGSSLYQYWKGFANTEKAWFKKYGKVFGVYQGFRLNVTISEPEKLKSILIKDFTNFMDRPNFGNLPDLLLNGLFFLRGRKWKKTRNILTPTLSSGKLKSMVGTVNTCANVLADNFVEHIGETVEVRPYFSSFTMDTIAATAFSLDLNSQKDPNHPFTTKMNKILFAPGNFGALPLLLVAIIPGIGPWLYKSGISFWSKKHVDYYENMGKALIAERRKDKEGHNDFLQLMLDAEYDETKIEYLHNNTTLENGTYGQAGNHSNGVTEAGNYSNGVTKAGNHSNSVANGQNKPKLANLSDENINAQTFVFFLAGMETTASLLQYCSYILALHPDMDERLMHEIDMHITQETPTYENLNKLKYMDQFICEVLRMYPSVPRLSRRTKADIQLGDIILPKDCTVVIPVYQIHHSEEFYPQPELFNPERFSPENKSSTDSVTYLPFGVGPRHCIGMRLALVEAKIALVYILRRVRFVKCQQTQVPLELQQVGTLRPKDPIQVQIEAR